MTDHRVRQSWDEKASEWNDWVGLHGDRNRQLNSDPVLWRMVGSVTALDVLDAGCGNGYLSIAMSRKGARVTGVDWSPEMIAQARENAARHDAPIELHESSCSDLSCLADDSFDLVVSNYVLMDAPDLEGTMAAFARILRPGGRVVCVFSHPCFDVIPERLSDQKVRYTWSRPYIERWTDTESWGPFSSAFTFFHRPLRDYWAAFRDAGFSVVDFDEPMVPADADIEPDALTRSRMTPFSVAFHLRR